MDETELRAFSVAITAISLFVLCLFFLEGEKKRERQKMVTKNSNTTDHVKSYQI